jgi:hypothetical protein
MLEGETLDIDKVGVYYAKLTAQNLLGVGRLGPGWVVSDPSPNQPHRNNL